MPRLAFRTHCLKRFGSSGDSRSPTTCKNVSHAQVYDALDTLGLKLIGRLAHGLARSAQWSEEMGDDAK